MDITSIHNERIKFVKRLHRRQFRDQHGLFIAEGIRLVEDMTQTNNIREVYYINKLLETNRGKRLVSAVKEQGIASYSCSDHVFSEICATENTQGVLAVVKQPLPITDWLHSITQGIVLVIDRIQDPGNLGSILRTALATAIDGIWLVKGTVDLFNPKVVRASMGAVCQVPYTVMSFEECITYAQDLGLELIISDTKGAVEYYNCDFSKPIALVIGNEANGVSHYFTDRATQRVYIPQSGCVESLNAAVAAAVLLYEVIRQRIQD